MQLVKDWLPRFIAIHTERHPRNDWPSLAMDAEGRYVTPQARRMFSQFLQILVPLGTDLPECVAASREVDGDLVEFYDYHPEELARAIRLIRDRPATLPVPVASGLPMPLSQMSDSERFAEAERMLDEFYLAGWSLEWYATDEHPGGALWPTRSKPGIPTMSGEWSARFRLLRPEVYTLMRCPLDEDPVLDMDDFRDEHGRFQFRRMAEALRCVKSTKDTVINGVGYGVAVGF
jgi:hypothetical protein